MKICIVTTDEETFFIPKGVNYLIKNIQFKTDVVCVPGFLNFKRIFYSLLTLYFFELLTVFYKKLINLFKSSHINKKTINIDNVNSAFFRNLILEKKYSLIVSYSCPQIFNKETLDFLKKEKIDIINFHPGILPKYKGIFINYHSLKNREKEVGITCHLISEKIDSGRILSIFRIPIEKTDTVFSLYKKIFLSENSLNFIKNSINNFDSIKHNKELVSDESNYNSFPKLINILKYRFKKF
tara:strand:+ start:864 stop:1583 length:720 start_codon:yes stop_codon:yes gene_type:complete